uniref:Uncharacterized protein n=1 Tax=Peronospora matthiolae TaxID=2874970 RepID=A0AAV1T9H2_9STRA
MHRIFRTVAAQDEDREGIALWSDVIEPSKTARDGSNRRIEPGKEQEHDVNEGTHNGNDFVTKLQADEQLARERLHEH